MPKAVDYRQNKPLGNLNQSTCRSSSVGGAGADFGDVRSAMSRLPKC
jgi:hypothetical protein